MRAFCVRRVSTMTQSGLAAMCSTKLWCSTEAKQENGDAQKPEEPISPEAIKALEKELEESKASLEEMKKELQYRTKDAENANRIGREDVDKARQYGITSFGKDMLEVADTLDKGLEAFQKLPVEELEADKVLSTVSTGIKLSLKVLHSNMSKHGIEKMGVTDGTPFDFNLHDALARVPATDKHPADTVCHVLKDGYTINDRVLRAAQVAVAFDDSQ